MTEPLRAIVVEQEAIPFLNSGQRESSSPICASSICTRMNSPANLGGVALFFEPVGEDQGRASSSGSSMIASRNACSLAIGFLLSPHFSVFVGRASRSPYEYAKMTASQDQQVNRSELAGGERRMAYPDFTLETVECVLESFRTPAISLARNAAAGAAVAGRTPGQRHAAVAAQRKGASEFIVAPILLASRELSHDAVSVYSGQRLDVDAEHGLVGECDFILSASPPVPVLRALW